MSNQFIEILAKQIINNKIKCTEEELFEKFKLSINNLPETEIKKEILNDLENYAKLLWEKISINKNKNSNEMIELIIKDIEFIKNNNDINIENLIPIITNINLLLTSLLDIWYDKPCDDNIINLLCKDLQYILSFYIIKNGYEKVTDVFNDEFYSLFNIIFQICIYYQKNENIKRLLTNLMIILIKDQVKLYQLLTSIPSFSLWNNKDEYFSSELIKKIFDLSILYIYPLPFYDSILKLQYKEATDIYAELAKSYFLDRVGDIKAIQIKINYSDN